GWGRAAFRTKRPGSSGGKKEGDSIWEDLGEECPRWRGRTCNGWCSFSRYWKESASRLGPRAGKINVDAPRGRGKVHSRAKDVIIPAKPPVSFFSSRSPVLDLFQGQLDYAEHVRRESEVALLFFYAPWCGQSIAARSEIERAASRLSDQVLFVAINCWWNQGKCRKQKHFFYFPVIYLYHRSFGPIEYKGPLSAVYIEKFVRRVMRPLLYIPSQSELLDFLSDYEPGVLGYFEFSGSPQPPGYLTFFTSALLSLKKGLSRGGHQLHGREHSQVGPGERRGASALAAAARRQEPPAQQRAQERTGAARVSAFRPLRRQPPFNRGASLNWPEPISDTSVALAGLPPHRLSAWASPSAWRWRGDGALAPPAPWPGSSGASLCG
uniref:Thioredoxin domain-containing protein n=1 Tax=Suricata suricatta TaxID=37032 RepID=A0A673VIF5_SURSU